MRTERVAVSRTENEPNSRKLRNFDKNRKSEERSKPVGQSVSQPASQPASQSASQPASKQASKKARKQERKKERKEGNEGGKKERNREIVLCKPREWRAWCSQKRDFVRASMRAALCWRRIREESQGG